MKKFSFRNAKMQIERIGYGAYTLKGLKTSVYTTNSTIFDYCDEDNEKGKKARKAAYLILKSVS